MWVRNTVQFLKRATDFNKQCIRFKSKFLEVQIPVPWGYIRGKWWGPTDRRPILTLHGWQDNCGTFNRLIPLLNQENVGFLAIDLPGNGYSSKIPKGLFYYNISNVILIQYISNYFDWPKVSLMAHSISAQASFSYTTIYPQNVDFLICIEGFKPVIHEKIFTKMEKNISNSTKYLYYEDDSEPPSYTMEEIKQKVCEPHNNSIAYEHAEHLIERNVAPSKLHPEKFYFTRDSRTKNYDLLNWPQECSMEGAKRITCPVLIFKAISASYFEAKENYYSVLNIVKQSSVDCQYHRVEGSHHVHLNNPERLSNTINEFVEKYVGDRSIGGIKEEIKQIVSM